MTKIQSLTWRAVTLTLLLGVLTPITSYANFFRDDHSITPFDEAYRSLSNIYESSPTLETHELLLHLLVAYQRVDLLALHLAESEPFNHGEHRSLHAFAQGFSAALSGQYTEAEAYYEKSLSLLPDNQDSDVSNTNLRQWKTTLLLHAAVNQAYLQRYTKAIEALAQIREDAEENGWQTLSGKADYFLGSVSYEINDYETALVHYQRALASYPANRTLLIAEAQMAEAQMINIVGERAAAFEILENAIFTFDKYQDAVALAYAYLLKSYFYSQDNNHEASLDWIAKSVKIREMLGNDIDTSNAYVHYASSLLENNRLEEARTYGLKAIALAEQNQDLAGQWDAYVSHAIILAELGEYKSAYEYMYKGERTLLRKARLDITTETARLNSEFNFKQQQLRNQMLDNANTILESQLQLKEQEQQRQKWTMVGLSTLLIFVVCFIFLIYALYKKNQLLATRDALTGIHNRRSIMELANQSFAVSKRYNSELCVLMLDIDSFKSINDNYGHHVGDEVLKFVATTATQTLRDCDYIGRIGGEEFLIVLPNTSSQQGLNLARRLCKNIETQSRRSKLGVESVTVSIGLAPNSTQCNDFPELCNFADVALYSAKNSGRNRAEVYA